MGIAVRFPYGEYDTRTERQPRTEKVQIGLINHIRFFSCEKFISFFLALRFILQRNVRIADWIYCNSTAEDNIGDTEESFRGYLKEKIEKGHIASCMYINNNHGSIMNLGEMNITQLISIVIHCFSLHEFPVSIILYFT